jgi:hypothetical protein
MVTPAPEFVEFPSPCTGRGVARQRDGERLLAIRLRNALALLAAGMAPRKRPVRFHPLPQADPHAAGRRALSRGIGAAPR